MLKGSIHQEVYNPKFIGIITASKYIKQNLVKLKKEHICNCSGIF